MGRRDSSYWWDYRRIQKEVRRLADDRERMLALTEKKARLSIYELSTLVQYCDSISSENSTIISRIERELDLRIVELKRIGEKMDTPVIKEYFASVEPLNSRCDVNPAQVLAFTFNPVNYLSFSPPSIANRARDLLERLNHLLLQDRDGVLEVQQRWLGEQLKGYYDRLAVEDQARRKSRRFENWLKDPQLFTELVFAIQNSPVERRAKAIRLCRYLTKPEDLLAATDVIIKIGSSPKVDEVLGEALEDVLPYLTGRLAMVQSYLWRKMSIGPELAPLVSYEFPVATEHLPSRFLARLSERENQLINRIQAAESFLQNIRLKLLNQRHASSLK